MNVSYTYNDIKQNLKKAVDIVNDTHEPILITSNKKPKAVLLSYDDYESLEETAYLSRSPAMVKKLSKAIKNIRSGKKEKHRIIEDEA